LWWPLEEQFKKAKQCADIDIAPVEAICSAEALLNLSLYMQRFFAGNFSHLLLIYVVVLLG
jgi:hypothetical protein